MSTIKRRLTELNFPQSLLSEISGVRNTNNETIEPRLNFELSSSNSLSKIKKEINHQIVSTFNLDNRCSTVSSV